MNKEELKNLAVGKTFVLGYRKFKVMESDCDNKCNGCFFDDENSYYGCLGADLQDNNIIPECYLGNRKDRKDVVFVEVEE